jgi:hypothetical protein
MLVKTMIETIGNQVSKPIKVQIDNIGAIFLASSTTTGKRTKHIDGRYHFAKTIVAEELFSFEL